jgi:hypothetical protein
LRITIFPSEIKVNHRQVLLGNFSIFLKFTSRKAERDAKSKRNPSGSARNKVTSFEKD